MKELTILEKVQEMVDAGLFGEDMVMCTDDFITGAYVVFDYNRRKYDSLHLISKPIFRKATPLDIIVGNTVYLVGDEEDIHTKEINEVLKPDDEWKAFVADDGCRYGLRKLYVC